MWYHTKVRFAERHSFNVLGFIQLLYDTTCANSDFWVKPVRGLVWMVMDIIMMNYLWTLVVYSCCIYSNQARARELAAYMYRQFNNFESSNFRVILSLLGGFWIPSTHTPYFFNLYPLMSFPFLVPASCPAF